MEVGLFGGFFLGLGFFDFGFFDVEAVDAAGSVDVNGELAFAVFGFFDGVFEDD